MPEPTARHILVTGSRDWTDQAVIAAAIYQAYMDLGALSTTLVTGGCPTGADRIAEMVWATNQHPIERYPADWERYGKRAGYVRNQHMVDLGADICLAFIKDGSRGASMTADMAERAGIETRRFTNQEAPDGRD